MSLLRIKQGIIYVLSMLIPRGKVVAFKSTPDYADNPYALFKSMVVHPAFAKYTFVWFLEERTPAKIAEIHAEHPEVIIPEGRLQEWWYLLRATFMIYSHSFYDDYAFFNRKKRINLWHGTGFKKSGIDNNEKPIRSDYLLTTNSTWKKYLAHSFVLPEDHVWPDGNPRTDLMFTPTDFFDQMHIDRKAYARVGIWMPTFRKHILLDTQEGQYDTSKIAGFSMQELEELDAFLRKIKGLLIIKLHMYDKLQELTFPDYTNIVIVKPKAYQGQLYPLLGATDYLITDYSSVSFDYDILNRPMGFVINDIRQYTDYRGFYEQDIESKLPGKIINDMKDLQAFIHDPEAYRVDTKNRFNDHKDDQVRQRVIEHLIALL